MTGSSVSVYVHFPYCLSKCPYCDFASVGIDRPEIPDAPYTDAVLREIEARWPLVAGASVPTMFFGGGTPSLWAPASVARVIESVAAHAGHPDEITLECNPTSLDESVAAAMLQAGVNRLSVGVQSLREPERRFLGRRHDGEAALAALRAAKRAGASRLNADLIYGLPGQDPARLADDLRRILDCGVTHVSAYALTIESGTPFGMLHREGRLPVATDDVAADCHETVERTLTDAGMSHYEVSNYAFPGEEARHNVHTWRGGDSLGVGAGAVSTISGSRHRNVGDGRRYVEGMARQDAMDEIVVEREALSTDTRIREAWMLGLRTAQGVDVVACSERLGRDPCAGREQILGRLERAGDVVRSGNVVQVPQGRWLVLDRILRDLM